jgi:hypothetical protein
MTTDLRTPDPVSHPSHYTSSDAKCSGCGKPIECIDVVQHMPFNLGSVVKYVWRHDLKGAPIQDLRKAIQYLEFEITRRQQTEDVTA